MQINLGNFGNAVAAPKRDSYVSADTAVPNALQNVASAGMKLANTFQAVDEQKQRMQAASTLATLDNDIYDIHDQVSRGIQDGSIQPKDAQTEFDTRVQEIKKTRTAGLSPFQLEAMTPHLTNTTGTLTRNLEGVAIKRTQQDIGASLLDTGETLQRQAMRDLPGAIDQYGKMVDTMGPQAGWNPEQIGKAKQGFKEGATFNFANATLEGAAQTGNLDLVRAARQKIEGSDGEPIDPAKRTALITKAYGYENGILAANARDAEKAAREQLARENAATDVQNKAFDLWASGRYLSQEFIAEASATVAGTAQERPFQELVKSQAKVAGFASMSLPQQQAEIERMRAAGSDPTIGVTPIEQKVQEQLQRIHDASAKAYQENPWQAAQERAVIKDAPVITLNNVQDAQQVLAQRMQQIGQVEVAAGRKISPLQPQEAEQIGRVVRALPPDQQSSALASFGAAVGDPDRLAALAHQIDAKDKVLGTAMMYANAKTTQGRYTSELILKGERALRDKSILVDSAKETGWRGAIAKEIGDAYPNQEVRDRMIDAAYYIQAGFSAEGGSTDTSRAVRLAAGQIVERGGSKFPLPYGMGEDEFNKRLKAVQPADLAAQAPGGTVRVGGTNVPLDQFTQSLPDAALVHAGQGKYNVRAGMGLVTNQQGKRITIEVR